MILRRPRRPLKLRQSARQFPARQILPPRHSELPVVFHHSADVPSFAHSNLYLPAHSLIYRVAGLGIHCKLVFCSLALGFALQASTGTLATPSTPKMRR